MGDVIGVLLGAMRRDQLDAAEGLIELLDCHELHLLEGNPISNDAAPNVTRYVFQLRTARKTPYDARRSATANPRQADISQCLVVAHTSALEAYLGIIRKCNVLIGTPAGVDEARRYKPLATYWTVPQ